MTTSLQELKRLMDEATPGEWEYVPPTLNPSRISGEGDNFMGGFRAGKIWVCNFGDCATYYPSEGSPPKKEDALLIIALRNAAHVLVAKTEAHDKIMALPVVQQPSTGLGYYKSTLGGVRIVPVADGEQIPMRNWPREPPHCPTCDCGSAGENGELSGPKKEGE